MNYLKNYELIQRPDGDWVNPGSVGAICINGLSVAFISTVGEELFTTDQTDHETALAFAGTVAEAINQKLTIENFQRLNYKA